MGTLGRAYPESGFGIGRAGTDAYHFTCIAKGLDATPSYSKHMKVAVQRARTHRPNHCWNPRIAGKCTSLNATPPLRASGNPVDMGQWRRYALVVLEDAQGTEER
ncbi:hypothetical protein MKX08_003871 [Trichoderma sp. CBMAI-0020]|nr:hypothetical protein MKX08_003871 [Trichoderma sp. CBMAI-0020]